MATHSTNGVRASEALDAYRSSNGANPELAAVLEIVIRQLAELTAAQHRQGEMVMARLDEMVKHNEVMEHAVFSARGEADAARIAAEAAERRMAERDAGAKDRPSSPSTPAAIRDTDE